jgi:ribosomal protein S18 acetylase RimI-like enzyme
MENVGTMIVAYQTEHQPWFEKFNRDWIEKYFWMEPVDIQVLQSPDEFIIRKGGDILMAMHEQELAGTVALKFVSPGVYEFTKMAVDEKFRGHGVGEALGKAAIRRAKEMGAHKIILYSNTILEPAITLYRKLGFREIPVDGPYKRSNIMMELPLVEDASKRKMIVRTCTLKDVPVIADLARKTFRETFDAFNTEENMTMYLDQNISPSKIEAEMLDIGAVFFVVEEERIPVGFAKVRTSHMPQELEGSKAIEIERIYVVKEKLGLGIGNILMARCLEHARKHRYEIIWLGVWEHNVAAQHFYHKWGFSKFGHHVFLLGTDAQTDLLLKKQLFTHGTPSSL